MRLDFETSAAEIDFAVGGAPDAPNFSDITSSADYSQKIRAGIEAAREGSRSEARALLLEAADAAPDNEDVWLRLASISEYPEELLVFLNNVLRINPANERAGEWAKATEAVLAQNFVERGTNALAANQSDFARQCFRQAVALDERGEAAWLGLAQTTESDEERNALLEKVLIFNPANETALAALAEAKAQTVERLFSKASGEAFAGDYAAADDALDEIFALAGETEHALLLKAFLASSFNEKTECWERVLRANPENELARAGTAFMRLLKLRLITPPEKELQAEFDTASGEEVEFFADDEEITPAESAFDSAKFYAERPTVEMKAEESSEAVFADEEVYEISADEEEFSLNSADEEGADYFQIIEETSNEETETQPEIYAKNQMPEQANLSADAEGTVEEHDEMSRTVSCPFCSRANDKQTFVCPSCQAVLTLSDLEMLLAHADANREIVRQAVERMEAEADSPDCSADELKYLGIGLFNLKHYRQGFSYLQEAVRANPNDVVLSSQVNALAIRLAEIEEQASIHSSMPKNKTILVVDDSATVRKLISGKLEKAGHAVLCAVDGLDALEKVEENVPDLILLDITMPRMDGYQVCKMIRTNEKTKDIPVVMISGKDGFFDKVRGRMAGTTGYITKPFGPETLMKTVESYIV